MVQWPIFGHESFIYCSMSGCRSLANRLTRGYRPGQITMQLKVLLQFNNNDNNNCVTFNVHCTISPLKIFHEINTTIITCISFSSLLSRFRRVSLCSIGTIVGSRN